MIPYRFEDAMICKSCKEELEPAEFYAGVQSRCKECHKAAMRVRREEKHEAILAYDRARANLPRRVAARKAYAKSDIGKEKLKAGQSAWIDRHTDKRRAHNLVWSAMRARRIIRPDICEECNSPCRPHAHHDDYSRPLDVRWLCEPCHVAWHKQDRALPVSGAMCNDNMEYGA